MSRSEYWPRRTRLPARPAPACGRPLRSSVSPSLRNHTHGRCQLCGGECRPVRNSGDPASRSTVAGSRGTEQVPGLAAQVPEVWAGWKGGHDVSFSSPWSACRAHQESPRSAVSQAGGGLCPARGPGGALQRPRATLGHDTVRDHAVVVARRTNTA
jgi:hypothetical protein